MLDTKQHIGRERQFVIFAHMKASGIKPRCRTTCDHDIRNYWFPWLNLCLLFFSFLSPSVSSSVASPQSYLWLLAQLRLLLAPPVLLPILAPDLKSCCDSGVNTTYTRRQLAEPTPSYSYRFPSGKHFICKMYSSCIKISDSWCPKGSNTVILPAAGFEAVISR